MMLNMPENTEEENQPPAELNPSNLKSDLEKIQESVVRKLQEKVDLQKLEAQATAELEEEENHGTTERVLLMSGAVILVFVLPFLHYFSAILLTLFALLVSLVAGLTSPKKQYSPMINLGVAVFGMLLFEYSAIVQFHTYSFTALFILYEVLAFIFLFAAFFSMMTYRGKILEK